MQVFNSFGILIFFCQLKEPVDRHFWRVFARMNNNKWLSCLKTSITIVLLFKNAHPELHAYHQHHKTRSFTSDENTLEFSFFPPILPSVLFSTVLSGNCLPARVHKLSLICTWRTTPFQRKLYFKIDSCLGEIQGIRLNKHAMIALQQPWRGIVKHWFYDVIELARASRDRLQLVVTCY